MTSNSNNRGFTRASAGFTLIETLLAVLILVVAIVGPMVIASKGLQISLIAKDQVTAAFLAQDAMEYIRFIRDTNKLHGSSDWLAGLNGANGCVSADGSAHCYLDSTNQQPSIPTTCGGVCPLMKLNSATHLYNYSSSATQTIFRRTITITTPSPSGNTSEAVVEVSVQWFDIGAVQRSVVLRDNLLDWQ